MSFLRKKLERRTYSQDRYYTLIKRQRAGEATFRDLIELDEIVNRVPDIREKVLRENFEEFANTDDSLPGPPTGNESPTNPVKRGLWYRVKSFIKQLLAFSNRAIQQEFSVLC